MRCWNGSVHKKFILVVLFCVIHLVTIFALFHGYNYFIRVTKLRNNVELLAVKGYSHCKVNDSALENFSANYQCDFRNVVPSNETLVVTFINSAWMSLAQNWVCSASKVGLRPNILLISLEPGVCKYMPGVSCYEHPNTSIKGTTFGQNEYRKLVTKRTEVLLKLLACRRNLLFVDADVVFMQNPLPFLEKAARDKDIVFQADSIAVSFVDLLLPYFLHYVCGGFIYMKSNTATKRLWLSVLQYQKYHFWNDQGGLNVCLRHHTQEVDWTTLDSDRFPNGQQYFVYDRRSDRNMIVHANHMMGIEKIMRLISAGVWCDDSSAVVACRSPIYVSKCKFHPNVPQSQWCRDFFQVCRLQYNVTA